MTRAELRILALAVLAAFLALLLSSCETAKPRITRSLPSYEPRLAKSDFQSVRTTAYTHTEAGGRRNAIGDRLSGREIKSAAADWSRWPLGTKFRIVDTDEVFQIDDYGSALVGTGTIDLYRTNRLAMKGWGVRSVDIDVIEWGSREKSLEVLNPRKKSRLVRKMILAFKTDEESNAKNF